jgi:hypothetical protein
MDGSTLRLRGCLTGARPVVGTVGACGLMLLACSWFALGPGDLGRSRDLGTPLPVRIGDVTGERPSAGALHRTATTRAPTGRGRIHDVSARRGVAAKVTIAPTGRKPSPKPTSAAKSSSTAPAAPSPAAAPATPGVPATQPAPLDGLAEGTLPPVSVPQIPAVTVPAVQLPDVSATTTQLGLP